MGGEKMFQVKVFDDEDRLNAFLKENVYIQIHDIKVNVLEDRNIILFTLIYKEK